MFSFFKKRSKDKSPRSEFEQNLYRYLTVRFGYAPNNLKLFVDAFTHKSFEIQRDGYENNERLEFLGDSVLDLIASNYLYLKFPEKNEGSLTKMKSNIVSRQSMSFIAKELDIIDHLRYKKNKNIVTETIEGNAFEALFGALYLDSDFKSCEKVFHYMVQKNKINIERIINSDFDFKSKLLIWCQRKKIELIFDVKEEINKGSHRMYKIVAILNEKEWGEGVGRSKKEAEQLSSQETLILLGEISS